MSGMGEGCLRRARLEESPSQGKESVAVACQGSENFKEVLRLDQKATAEAPVTLTRNLATEICWLICQKNKKIKA